VLTRIDHIGIACRDLAAQISFYQEVFGLELISEEVNEPQGVREAMLRVTESPAGLSCVQLLEPLAPETPVGKFLATRGAGVHHVGYGVTDITAALDELGGRGLRLVDSRPPARLDGRLDCVPAPEKRGGVLTELVQAAQQP
jgi:methylmalonyl-CoA/ethylmalonyl-CoA epimerase